MTIFISAEKREKRLRKSEIFGTQNVNNISGASPYLWILNRYSFGQTNGTCDGACPVHSEIFHQVYRLILHEQHILAVELGQLKYEYI
mgnify:CR=1 FL=1